MRMRTVRHAGISIFCAGMWSKTAGRRSTWLRGSKGLVKVYRPSVELFKERLKGVEGMIELARLRTRPQPIGEGSDKAPADRPI